MSYYINMDHAGWVERNIAASKSREPNAREKRAASDNKGWFGAPDQLNTFQYRALGILGIVGNGIYNAPISWDGVHWTPRMIAVNWRNSLGTFDFTSLTRFVFLCHEARIRGEISPKGFRHVEIMLSQRTHGGAMHARHPNLDEAVTAFRAEFSRSHSINYAPISTTIESEKVA